MKKMTSNEIRKSWIKFFESKKHLFLEAASLVPKDDPSLLWINSGVATLKKYFSGQENPPAKRLVNCQKAIRTNDIFNVGKTSRHQTLFEMLGNFSIGDYFKKEAINFAFELLTKVWEIDIKDLWFTVYKEDETAWKEWQKLGIRKERILRCDRDRNFWDIGSGPCGSCTEIYYDRGPKYDFSNLGEKLIIEDIENDRFIEIWNIVFSEFNNEGNGKYTELLRKNIDTGAGLERIASISQDVPTNFDTDLFLPIINKIQNHSTKKYEVANFFIKDKQQDLINFRYRVIVDHLRATSFAIADGVVPSNKEKGYILRRLIRRAMVCADLLEIKSNEFINEAINEIINIMKEYYPYLIEKQQLILDILNEEYDVFKKTLLNGLKHFNKSVVNNTIDANVCFDLVTTYGLPFDLIKEICEDQKIQYDEAKFDELYKNHQEISNAKKNIVGIDKQNSNLLALNVESKFDYNIYTTDAKVIALFNKNFDAVKKLNNEEGYAVFNVTPFYATSGGQVCDTGYINDHQFIDDVFKGPNLQHIHHSKNFSLELNENVRLSINKNDRERLRCQHSSEHLLHAALKNIVSSEIKQEGAFKSTKKITLDFSLPYKLSDQQLKEVEKWVNDQISKKIKVDVLLMSLDEAKQNNVVAHFENVYKKLGEKLRVIKMGDVSSELCGGTHVDNLANIEKFNIIGYYSKGSGSWRIEAASTNDLIDEIKNNKLEEYKQNIIKYQTEISKNSADVDLNKMSDAIKKFYDDLKDASIFEIDEIYTRLKEYFETTKRQIESTNSSKQIDDVINIVKKHPNVVQQLIFLKPDFDTSHTKNLVDKLVNEHKEHSYLLIKENKENNINQCYIFANIDFVNKNNLNFNQLFTELKQQGFETKGGGRNNFVQGSIKFDSTNKQKLIDYLAQTKKYQICE